MKNIIPFLLLSTLLCLTVISCEDDLPTEVQFEDYAFTDVDADGGSWKTTLLASPEQITMQAPAVASSDAYQQELATVKSNMENISRHQQQAITYWSSNPVLRWNEIALEMAAKYNLIPGPNDDGTYTLPDPANPEKYPQFPFAHPPYTCRALAYLSVAQYDGLITAWHYKYLYNRPAPYQADNAIEPAYTGNNIPGYPSDGAVVAIVSREILSVLFPLEKEFLAEKAAQHLESLGLTGMNTESDIVAGEVIGAEIATLALQRASTDGMKYAQAPKPVSDSIKAAAFARFGWQWDNMEEPVRPVGLTPLFGKVKMWNVPTVEEVRPGPPPAPGTAEFEENVKELKDIANNMTEEKRRIANWWQDGLGTYTPPGHWNKFAKDYIIKYKQNPLRTARTFAYINMAMMDAGISCWDAKYYYHYPRPIQTIPGFKTIAGTPNFPSYTSGHSVFSSAAAEVLSYIFPADAGQFDKWAEEAAVSRIYGGIHYRFDAEVGIEQGRQVASYTVNVAMNDGADL